MTEVWSDAADALADRIAAHSDSISPHALGCALLREDSHTTTLRADEVSALVEASLADGAMLAEQVGQRWGNEPDAIAAGNAIPIADIEADGGYGTTLVFAQYRTRPIGIELYRPVIDALDQRLQQSRLGRALGVDRTRAVFLAHELYHHFDEARVRPLCARHRLPLLRLGWLRLSVAVPGMREIAAGAFAQHLLRLRFHPRLLDIAAVALWRQPALEQALRRRERATPRRSARGQRPVRCPPASPSAPAARDGCPR